MSPTDWSVYQVPQMASFLHDDREPAWTQVGAWRGTHNVLLDAAAALARARGQLAELWPEGQSAAATAFFDFADGLAASMRDTAAVAQANATALQNTLSALGAAQSSVDDLHAEWQTYAAHAESTGGPDASSQWAQDLNAKAQTQMATTDDIIFDNARRLLVANPFFPPTREPLTPIPAGADGGGASGIEWHAARGVTGRDMPGAGVAGAGVSGGQVAGAGIARGDVAAPRRSPTLTGPVAGVVTPGSGGGPLEEPVSRNRGQRPAGEQVAEPSGFDNRRVEAGSTAGSVATGRGPAMNRQATSTSPISSAAGEGRPSPGSVEPANGPVGTAGLFAPTTGGLVGSDKARRGRRYGTPERWPMPASVPSIIMPNDNVEVHNPGPGVIGIDR
jgi:hypothetical protein